MRKSLQDPEFKAFKRKVVAAANEFAKVLTGDFAQVRALIEEHPLVFAVWQDASEVDRVGMMLIKGQQLLREVIASGEAPRNVVDRSPM